MAHSELGRGRYSSCISECGPLGTERPLGSGSPLLGCRQSLLDPRPAFQLGEAVTLSQNGGSARIQIPLDPQLSAGAILMLMNGVGVREVLKGKLPTEEPSPARPASLFAKAETSRVIFSTTSSCPAPVLPQRPCSSASPLAGWPALFGVYELDSPI